MRRKDARYWIDKLKLETHPEGGYFRQTYKADLMLAEAALPAGFAGDRAASTAIYFLLEGENFSAFHRLRSDEVWHFYAGEALVVHVIEPAGKCLRILLGRDLEAGRSASLSSSGVLVCIARGGLEIVGAGGVCGGSGI